MKSITFHEADFGVEWEENDIPEDMLADANHWREKMLESISDFNDSLMESYLEGRDIPPEEIIAALRQATIACKVTPVLCGSSFKYKGVQRLLDAILHYLPSPLDVKPVSGFNPHNNKEETRETASDQPFAALAFKIMTDPFIGKLTYFRVYSGRIEAGEVAMNTNTGKRERLNRIVRMFANKREELKLAEAGDIVAGIGLHNTRTGDTLSSLAAPIQLERMVFPEPVIQVSVEPPSQAEAEKMGDALYKLADEDPTFRVTVDSESGQTLIAGMGELHLEVLVERIRREFGIKVTQGKPRVSYRETITRHASGEGRFIRQSGGRGQYGHVKIEIEPGEPGSGYKFENKIVGGVIPKEYIEPANKGMQEALDSGPIAGNKVIDVSVTLLDGSFHEVDSSELAFKIAGSMAIKNAIEHAAPVLLEPIMKVEVVLPDVYMGDVVGDLNSRRARITGIDVRGNAQVITAESPLANMFGYATNLRSMSQGRALFTMEFLRYDPVPAQIQQELIEKARGGY